MATHQPSVLQHEFELFFKLAPTVGLERLCSQLPGHNALRRLADEAGQLVQTLEEYLGRRDVVCVPVHLDIGQIDTVMYLDATRNRYALGVAKVGGTWRVLVYRWVRLGGDNDDSRGSSAPVITPWLESPVAERIMTLPSLPKLCDELANAISGLMRVGSQGEAAVQQFSEKIVNINDAIPLRVPIK